MATQIQIRQGEVMLVKVNPEAVPAGYASAVTQRALLAHGESGNTHTVVPEVDSSVAWLYDAAMDISGINKESAAKLIERNPRKVMFVKVEGAGQVIHSDQHEAHAPAPVGEGTYMILVKREQFPWEKEARFVAD
jgi:hypothetical protein